MVKLNLIDLIAVWGAITGSAGLVFTYFNYKRDQADIKLTFTKNWKIIGNHPYDPKETYASLTVANKGRRPVTITKTAGIYLKNKGGFIFSDSMIYGSRELKEGKSADFLTKQKDLDLKNISYFAAYDAVGNIYRLNMSPFYKRFIYWLLDKTHLKVKQSVVLSKS